MLYTEFEVILTQITVFENSMYYNKNKWYLYVNLFQGFLVQKQVQKLCTNRTKLITFTFTFFNTTLKIRM